MAQDLRVRQLCSAPPRSEGKFILYWCQANRRVDWNPALLHAVELGNELDKPVLFCEGLNLDHPYSSPRINGFIFDGARENAERAAQLGIGYTFRTEPLEGVVRDAVALVTDDYPSYIVDSHNRKLPQRLGLPYYAVDASCIVPMSAIGVQQWAAYTIRPKIHKLLPTYLGPLPEPHLRRRWSEPIEQPRVTGSGEGGRAEGLKRLERFVAQKAARYAEWNRDPADEGTSKLSAYLHFGHLSSMEVALRAGNSPEFLEQLIVRRELAFNFARYGPSPKTLAALPDWARATLDAHAKDDRPWLYTFEQFETAATHDALWNAAQRELLETGTIHGYYRMYWGKKIIEWSASHQEALTTMIELNDKWALDGRDPNGYTNILWCLGLHDRPWVERAVFGKVRYMAESGMRRKTDADAYLRRWGGPRLF